MEQGGNPMGHSANDSTWSLCTRRDGPHWASERIRPLWATARGHHGPKHETRHRPLWNEKRDTVRYVNPAPVQGGRSMARHNTCLLYTSDAADDTPC
eukprot:1087381-Pyramimonas_sp.AAC.1